MWDDDEFNPHYSRVGSEKVRIKGLSKHTPSGSSRSSFHNSSSINESVFKQNVVFTASYREGKSGNYHQEKVNYILGEDKGVGGFEAENFGNVSKDDFMGNVKDRSFHFIISPDNPNADVQAATEKMLKRLKYVTGYDFNYIAAVHYDTGHPHAHVYIDGYDVKGNPIRFPKNEIKKGIREHLRDIVTDQLGKRSLEEIQVERETNLKKTRVIDVDYLIESLTEENKLNVGPLKSQLSPASLKRVMTRLETLSEMGLCDRNKPTLIFDRNWMRTLRASSKYNDYLLCRNNLENNSPLHFKEYRGGFPIGGKVTEKHHYKDGFYNDSFVVECPDGDSFYIPTNPNKSKYEVGDNVRVFAKRSKNLLDVDVQKKSRNTIMEMYSGKDGYVPGN